MCRFLLFGRFQYPQETWTLQADRNSLGRTPQMEGLDTEGLMETMVSNSWERKMSALSQHVSFSLSMLYIS